MTEPELIATAAAQIVQQARQHPNTLRSFRFTPTTGLVEELKENTQPPFATETGDEEELITLLLSFGDWKGALKIGVLQEEEGLLDFWLY